MENAQMQDVIQLAPRMAHRIRDKVSFIRDVMQSVIDDKSISIDARDKIALLKAYLENVAQHARQFLIITDTLNCDRTVLDIRIVLSELTSLLKNLLGEGYTLQMALDDNLWLIQDDVEQFEEILLPLVVNARDAMPSGGTVRIAASNITKAQCEAKAECATFPADYVLIEVTDTGVGMPKDVLDRVFEPFFSTKRPGCSFALAHVRSAVKKLNGEISVESNVGKGATFSVFLPRYLGELQKPTSETFV